MKLLKLFPLLLLLLIGCTKSEKSYEERMAEEHADDTPVANAAWTETSAEIDTQSVVYAKVNGEEITGYFAEPAEGPDALPGIIVIHEWWGLNDNIKMMTRRLADQGYSALAVDLYNGNVASSPDNARTYMSEAMSDQNAVTENLKSAYQYLTEQQQAGTVGTIGWCFGGGMSLNTALALPNDIDATVIYYGRLVTDKETLKPLDMPILGFFGSEDQGIPVEQVKEFESALNELGKDAKVHIYEGANHAFANPSGQSYDKEAAEDAWKKTLAFFKEHLK